MMKQPKVNNQAKFGATWKLWWATMQPAWRGGKSLGTAIPTDADWKSVLRGGPNGLFMVILALSWWVCAMKPDQQDLELFKSINDVEWVLSELVSTLSLDKGKTGKKRPFENSTEELTSKK
jgi:hypothetical protein